MFPSLSKCRTKKVFLALFILTTVNAQSEEQITGFVYHAETSAPLVGVNVILLGTDLGAATNESGSFSISNVAQGEYNLLVSAIGFSETLEIVKVPLESPLEIWLMETFFQMEEVVVTGTRTEKIHAEAPIATEIISKQDILDSGARDVGELLDERAGISMSESVEGGTIINMLGMDSKYILVLVDGQPVTGKFNSRIGLDQIPLLQWIRLRLSKDQVLLYTEVKLWGV